MKEIMLTAGIGAQLGFSATEHPPNVLLRYGGKSWPQFHIEIPEHRAAILINRDMNRSITQGQ